MDPLTLTLIKLFGPTMARALLAALLKDHIELDAIGSGDLAETLADSLDIPALVDKVTDNDYHASRNAARIFDRIGDKAAERLFELFRHQQVDLAEAERDIVLQAAKDTLNRRAMPLLFEAKLDARQFQQTLSNEPPIKTYGLIGDTQHDVYRRILSTAAQLIFAVADEIPHFTRDATATLLQNEDSLVTKMDKALEDQQRILAETYGQQQNKKSRQFESIYRTVLAKTLDQLTLFGIDMFDGAKQPLSVAFIKLNLSLVKEPWIKAGDKIPLGDSSVIVTEAYEGARQDLQPVSPEKALGLNSRLLVVGNAGYGKTTLLKWAAVQTASAKLTDDLQAWTGRLPFFIRLRDFANRPLPTFAKLLDTPDMRHFADSPPDDWVTGWLQTNQAIVLLDGLDEVSDAKRDEALTWLEQLLAAYPETITIVSTRPSPLEDEAFKASLLNHLGFQQANLGKMEGDLIDQFVEQWYRAMGHDHCHYLNKSRLPDHQTTLLTMLQHQPELRKLCETPLLAAMICALHLTELGRLPRDKIKLYDRCINLLLSRDEKRGVDVSSYGNIPRPQSTRWQLGRLAYWMLRNNNTVVQRVDAERVIGEGGYEGPHLIRFLSERTGILQKQAQDEFDFIHRTFQEFLAAQQIVKANDIQTVIQGHGKKPEWHETIRLIAGEAQDSRDQERLLDALLTLATNNPDQARIYHLLAWDFWELLDIPTEAARELWYTHVMALGKESTVLDLRNTQVSDVSALSGLTNLQ
ncbi:MAG: NACHT domain-containing protein, partial [Chloroflexota bacterium]